MAGPRVEYREAGASIREAVRRLPADATGLQARVLLALVALVSSYSRRSDEVHLAAIAEQLYGTPGEPFTATRTQTSRLRKVLGELAKQGVIELERPGKGRPPSDRRPYYRVTFPAASPESASPEAPDNAAPQDRVTPENAAPQHAERGPTEPRNAAPQGYPYEKNEKNSEKGPALTVADLLGRQSTQLAEEAAALELALVDQFGEAITRRAIADAHRKHLTGYPSQLRLALTAACERLVVERNSRQRDLRAERERRRASCNTCNGDGQHPIGRPCPDCMGWEPAEDAA